MRYLTLNGHETYEQIIKIHPNQKAINAGGFAETDDVKETQRLGAGQYIKKPLTLDSNFKYHPPQKPQISLSDLFITNYLFFHILHSIFANLEYRTLAIMILKPQDVVILLKLVVIRKADSAVADLLLSNHKKIFCSKMLKKHVFVNLLSTLSVQKTFSGCR